MLFLFILITQLFAPAHAEIVDQFVNPETMMDRRYQPTYTWRGAPAINASIRSEVEYLRKLKGSGGRRGHGRGMDYAYINKFDGKDSFNTYLVHLDSGRVIDTFPSLISYRGMGCGKDQTRPGVALLTNRSGVNRSKRHWGNGKYYWIKRVEGVSPCQYTDANEILAHVNTNLNNKDMNDSVNSRSAGCFVMSSARAKQLTKYAGNAYIYNVPNNYRGRAGGYAKSYRKKHRRYRRA